MRSLVLSAVLCALFCVTPSAFAKHHHRHQDDDAQSGGQFDYYLLALSWAPNYCAGHPRTIPANARPAGIPHSYCMACGHKPAAARRLCRARRPAPVAAATVDHMLNYMPSRGLIQHEWQKHGTCSGLSAQDYFAKVEQAFKRRTRSGAVSEAGPRSADSACPI